MERQIFMNKGQVELLTPGTIVGIGYPKMHNVCQVLEGGNVKFLFHHWELSDFETFCKEMSKRA